MPLMKTPLAVAAVLWFASLPAPAATNAEHYEALQRMRAEARAAVQATPGDAGRRAAVAKLEAALAYLDRPDGAHAPGSHALYMKGVDLRLDLAAQYAALGRKDAALDTLAAIANLALAPPIAQMLERAPEFAPLRDEPRFKTLLAAHRAAVNGGGGAALPTAYRATLPLAERVAGLSLFWSEARSQFAWFDHVPDLDWDRVYLDTLPQVMAAESTEEYYRVLMRLAPLLRDGHTNIYPPQELARRFFARPPVRTELVEGKVLVRTIDSPSLRARLAVGDEIVAIDGQPVRDYATQNVAPYVSSSTPQDHDVRTYGYQLLGGDPARPVALRVRDAQGRERDVTVARDGYRDIEPTPPAEFRMLPGNVAYLAVNGFDTDAGVKALEAALPQVMQAAGLVLDLRRNGGGNSDNGYLLLGYLSDKPVRLPRSFGRGGEGYTRAQGGPAMQWVPLASSGIMWTGPARAQRYAGPVAVLTGPRTFSAGEDFVAAWQQLGRGPTVGTATAGSSGQPLFFDLPGGGKARICVKRDVREDGSTFIGTGLAPTVAVPVTVADVRAGRDTQLERALAALKAAPGSSAP